MYLYVLLIAQKSLAVTNTGSRPNTGWPQVDSANVSESKQPASGVPVGMGRQVGVAM